MGAKFAHNSPQMQLNDNFKGVFAVIQPQYVRVFALFHYRGRNMDSPQEIGNSATVETVGFSGQIGSEEHQGESVSQQTLEANFMD